MVQWAWHGAVLGPPSIGGGPFLCPRKPNLSRSPVCYDVTMSRDPETRADEGPSIPRSIRFPERLFEEYRTAVKDMDPEDDWSRHLRRYVRQFLAERKAGQ